MAICQRGSLTRASNKGGVAKNRDSRRMSGYRIDDWWGVNRNCDDRPCSLLHKPSRIRESCLSQPAAWTTKTKREQNRIRSGTSEAEVTNNIEDCARLIVLLQLTTDRHEAFRVAPALAGGGSLDPRRKFCLPTRIHKVILQETTATMVCTHYQLSKFDKQKLQKLQNTARTSYKQRNKLE